MSTYAINPSCLDSIFAEFRDVLSNHGDPFGLFEYAKNEYPRYLRVCNLLARWKETSPNRTKLCDLGGHAGVMGAIFSMMGYSVTVVDNYDVFGDDFLETIAPLWRKYRLQGKSIDLQASDLHLPMEDETVDIVTMLAVIEHFPHTPRYVLQEIKRILKPGGMLVIDTPNGGKIGHRVGVFLHGRMSYPPVKELYDSSIPYLGHYREYGLKDLEVLLELAGFTNIHVESFDLIPRNPPRSLKGRILYGVVYPLLIKPFFPSLRGYLVATAIRE